jgi:hypothetical protein
VPAVARSYVNTTTVPTGFGVVPGTLYTYQVRAQTPATGVATNQSLPSASVTIDYSTPLAPANLAVVRVQRSTLTATPDRVDLSWTATAAVANRPAVSGYTIEWSTTPAFTTVTGSYAAAAGSTTATNVITVPRGAAATPAPSAYYFRIRANNVVGNGVPSTVLGPVNTL